MNHRVDRWGGLVVGYCVAARYCLAAMALASVMQMARGQEELPPPLPTPPGASSRQGLIDHQPRILILTNVSPGVLANVSALGQLFQHAGGPTGCEEMLQRIGVEQNHDVADHPIAAPDPGMSLVVERVTEALRAELGNNVMFRVTARAHAGEFPGQLLQENCNGATCCEEMLNRIGADHAAGGQPRAMEINVHVISPIPQPGHAIVLNRSSLPPGTTIDARNLRHSERRLKAATLHRAAEGEDTDEVQTSFLRLGCAACGLGECNCGSECATAGCTAAGCPALATTTTVSSDCKCDDCKCGEEEAKCGEDEGATLTMVVDHGEHHDEFADYHPLKLMRHIAGLMAEKAAAEAALEVKTEAHEELAELYEAMAEVMADNAALDAKLIAAAEQRTLLERVTDLATENARLKAHVELAAERIEMAKSSVALALENEHLKQRLADLEQKHAAAEAARTAANSSGQHPR